LCEHCRQAAAVIEDLDPEPPRAWCLGCAMVLVTVGDPVANYRELDGGAAYTTALAGRSTMKTLRFR
jgi:hypothetical protein